MQQKSDIKTLYMKRLKPGETPAKGRRLKTKSLESIKRISLFEEICQLGDSLLGQSSLHAVGWVPSIKNPLLKTVLFCVVLLVMISLPLIALQTIMAFYNNVIVMTSVEYTESLSMAYPNVTICNPKFFDIRKFKKYHLPDDIADYLPMAMDPALGDYKKFMESIEGAGQNFIQKMEKFEKILDDTLEKHNMTILELFEALAIDCNDFVIFCSYQGKFFTSPRVSGLDRGTCCQELFSSQQPAFSSAGTCYTTNKKISEDQPSTYSSLEIYVDIRNDITPTYHMNMSASRASLRSGAYWAVSGAKDYPSAVMVTEQRRASVGTLTLVGLRKTEIDRSSLNIPGEKPCVYEDQSFTDQSGGIPYTKANCETLLFHYVYPNCSLAVIMGYKELPGIPACLPKDMESHEGNLLSEYRKKAASNGDTCPYECRRTEFELTTSSSVMNDQALTDYVNQPAVLANLNRTEPLDMSNVLGLQLYFQSFSYRVNVLSQETLLDILSKIGGTMGLIIGASIISFFENAYFLFSFCSIIVRRLVRVRRNS